MNDSSKPNAAVTVGDVTFGNERPIAVFAGPLAPGTVPR